jgi:hypothetical protein
LVEYQGIAGGNISLGRIPHGFTIVCGQPAEHAWQDTIETC